MTVYNKSDLENNLLNQEAQLLLYMKFISKEKQKNISNQLNIFKTSENWFVRLGFSLLGCLLFSSILGSFSFFMMPLFEHNYKLAPYIYFVFGIVGIEFLARQNYFQHGLDDAFILSLQLCLCIGIGLTFENTLASFITMTFIGFFCSVRYVHTISALVICIGILLTVFYAITEYKIIDAIYLPFFGFFLAVSLFIISKKIIQKSEFYIYRNAIQIVQIFSYLLIYFSLNYLVVRQLSEELLNIVVNKNEDIPFAFVFFIYTFLIPICFLYFSLRNKDRILFYISCITFVFSIFTIRYYHSILPIEIALTLGGIILFTLSYFFIRFLKSKETGITFLADRNSNKSVFLDAQALIINSQIDIKNAEPQQNMKFGGGGFSGGGANGNY